MGVFDYVKFEEPLPDLPVDIITEGRNRPQTKSFHFPTMDTYVISDGKLYRHVKEYRGTGKFEERFIGSHSMGDWEVQELIAEVDVPIFYHGDINLSCTTQNGEYVRLIARFTDGNLEWVKREEDVVYE